MTLPARKSPTVGVCLPALNEEGTVGSICRTISSELLEPGVIHQLVVIDSGSTDRTAAEAQGAGATVYAAAELVPAAPSIDMPGKGESLWKSLAVMETDIVVWVDSDTRNFSSSFITDLVAPLIDEARLVFTKAYYDRPLEGRSGLLPMGGARVTEIGIRPLLNLLYPELAELIQPLSGEYAGRREALIDIPFRTGYDVDIMILVELVQRHGFSSIAQVDLGSRVHRNRDIPALGRMSFEIMRSLLERLEFDGRLKLAEELPDSMVQFTDEDGGRSTTTYTSHSEQRPPMRAFLEG